MLAVYALMAEWRALLDPATESNVARLKLTWWREELRRLAAGSPLHPATRFLASLPHAARADLSQLQSSVDAWADQLDGVPLERADELAAHANALFGTPLRVAAEISNLRGNAGLNDACASLAAGEYLSRAVADYRREVHAGRLPFAVDGLLAARIDNEDLAAAAAPARLQVHLQQLRLEAARHFAAASHTLAAGPAGGVRHLAVLATLGANRLQKNRSPADADFSLADLYNAWTAARRAAAAR